MYSRTSIIQTLDYPKIVLLEYLLRGVFSITVVQQSSVYKSIGFIYLNIFVIQLAQRCSDNGDPTAVKSALCM